MAILLIGFSKDVPEDQARSDAEVELHELAERRGMSVISTVLTRVVHDAEREAVGEYAVEVWADLV